MSQSSITFSETFKAGEQKIWILMKIGQNRITPIQIDAEFSFLLESKQNLRYSAQGKLSAFVGRFIAVGFIPYEEWAVANEGMPTWIWSICQNYNMDRAIGSCRTDFTLADSPCVAPMNWVG